MERSSQTFGQQRSSNCFCCLSLSKVKEKWQNIDAYRNVLIEEYSQLEAIEKEPEPQQKGCYMPHHAVVRQVTATTKLRIIFNVSAAKKKPKYLNDLLEPESSLLPDLPDLLLRFCEFEHAIHADIKNVFFPNAVKPADRPFLRFIWSDQQGHLEIWRLKKLPFGVNCSPFILNATLQHHFKQERLATDIEEVRRVIELLLRSFYVDDCITSVTSHEKVIHFQQTSGEVLARAGMELRKWRGNSIICNEEAGEEALGIVWDLPSDTLFVMYNATYTHITSSF